MLQMFAIKDDKVDSFNTPFTVPHETHAIRNVKSMLIHEHNSITEYPEDFSLYHIGCFDDTTGRILPNDTPVHIVNLKTLLPAEE
jgi:hypothetical protein